MSMILGKTYLKKVVETKELFQHGVKLLDGTVQFLYLLGRPSSDLQWIFWFGIGCKYTRQRVTNMNQYEWQRVKVKRNTV